MNTTIGNIYVSPANPEDVPMVFRLCPGQEKDVALWKQPQFVKMGTQEDADTLNEYFKTNNLNLKAELKDINA